MRMKSPREWILPVALSLASILLTSLVLAEAHSHLTAFHVWSDPEDLALAYLLPTIFIAVFFGSTIAVMSSFASGLAAAYFIYPPKFSVLIDDSQQVAELGFIIVLAITASKAVAVITDDKPLIRRGWKRGGREPPSPRHRLSCAYRKASFCDHLFRHSPLAIKLVAFGKVAFTQSIEHAYEHE